MSLRLPATLVLVAARRTTITARGMRFDAIPAGPADGELVQAVRLAAAGESYLNPRLGARLAAEPPPGPPDNLSEREVDVLRLIALGHTNTEIAQKLYISVRTVETHRGHISQKLFRGCGSSVNSIFTAQPFPRQY